MVVATAVGLTVTAPLAGQAAASSDQPGPADTTRIRYYGGLGPSTRPISTSSDSAQLYFNEGRNWIYAFGVEYALNAFRAAQMHDPKCAMCYWGEAWANAPYLNGPASLEKQRRSYAAVQQALAHAEGASSVERALIDAFAVRFVEDPTAEARKPLDSLYARRMSEVHERFPDDLDVATLYGESLMLLRPRRGSVDLEAEDVKAILPVLTGVLERDIRHPGACHLYIHLVEASEDPALAEACSEYLGDMIAVSHIRHMPSHIYMNVGRYGDAVTSNQRAWHADQMAEHDGPPGVYPSHNLHMLLFAAILDGQSAVAIQAARDLSREQPSWGWYLPVTLAHFGRWDEVLELNGEAEDPFNEAMRRYSHGLAHLRTGDTIAARADLTYLDGVRATLADSLRFRFHAQNEVLEIPAGILAGEIALAVGDDHAVELLRQAVAAEDGLVYDEPEPWQQPTRHFLGAALLDLGRAPEAEAVYREALEDHAGTGWALFGLEQALRAQEKSAEAEMVRAERERSWARSDLWLRASRY